MFCQFQFSIFIKGQVVAPFEELKQKKLKFSIGQAQENGNVGHVFSASHCGFTWEPEENVPVSHQPAEKRQADDRIALLNKVNMGLIERTNFAHIRDGKDKEKIQSFKQVIDRLCASETTSEFVLQVALYARRGLNIRTAANFIVACAACHAQSKGQGSKT